MELYNTLTRKVDKLNPLQDKRVSIYTCGLTVYAQPHIGNWVPYIYWDVLVRSLKASGYSVMRVQNYTDVGHLVSDDDNGEDKMEKGARAEGLTAWDIADKYIDIADHEAYEQLGLLRPDKLVRATSCIKEQIDFVRSLEEKGFTYTIKDEGIYFDTSKLSDYGKLARLDIKGLQAGARVDVAGKKNITDFALWKFSPTDKQRDMEWDSPWGKGFPGWHLECSVIARDNLGDQIDIHTGGIDHIPVHHTNEIAQTESLTGKQFAQIWLHNNHLKVEGGKMSKSLGNIYTLRDITDRGYDVMAFKLMVLSKHYRTEGNFTWSILESFQNRLNNWKSAFDTIWQVKPDNSNDTSAQNKLNDTNMRIVEALRNDIDTPEAIAQVDSIVRLINNRGISYDLIPMVKESLHIIQEIMGLRISGGDITVEQRAILTSREEARKEKNWVESDELRLQLQEQGIGVRDSQYGQIWYRL